MSDFKFFHPIEVRYGDLDPQGHVNNAKHLTYFEQARVRYLMELGLFGKDQSFMEIGVIIAEARVTYRAPIHYGDALQIGVRTAKIGNKSMTVEQCAADGSGKIFSDGTLILVTYDYAAGKSIPVPDEWRRKISEYEGI